jgi:hypothetical protein
MADNKMTQEDYLHDISHQLDTLEDIKKLLKETNEKLQLIQGELRSIKQNTSR